MTRPVITFLTLMAVLLSPRSFAEVVVVGFGTHKPPYVFEYDGSGLEYELIEAALEHVGLEMEPYYSPLERLHRMLQYRELGAMATTNQTSGVDAHYSEIYIEYENVAVTLQNRNIQLGAIEDLGGYSISAFQRARFVLGPRFGKMTAANSRYREEARQITRNLLLYAGRVDVMIGDRRIIRAFNSEIADRVDVSQPVTEHFLFPPTGYRVGFVDAAIRDRFDQGLAAIRSNGRYELITQRYAAY
ncbi:substrate-binding periplasmic protein [Halopseudomonas salina]|uniref:Polar amino acid ABC transporter n=1 Tax=Halopseudomonas salina TaxID=1323744 RepID=A0ABQ1NYX4_9GAMM|nr:ABC transporter substrate-binding protein [Halopseudomonas salina]GGC87959.1 polar amino acid ABC transporter [Halopseudomonas salina]